MKTMGGTIAAITAAALLTAGAATQTAAATKQADAAPTQGAATAKPAEAAPKRVYTRTRAFDGIWSVTINTVNGNCPTGLRYPAKIADGRVGQAYQDPGYSMGGIVLTGGAIAVTVAAGNESASGRGRLKRTDGAGFWRTRDGQCSGTWTAVRRD